jgi:phosphoribosylaminoimidazolecarboxamide formyltransferase/IMP cyclohydrolase
MSTIRRIKNVLISVYHKDNLEPILAQLKQLQASIYTTGGTQVFIELQGIETKRIEDLTGYPSILGGRVKTLHPNVFGGILARKHLPEDIETQEKYGIPFFDLVIVDLYPFQETVNSKASEDDIIEKIDIGGISLIRAAAKNYKDVLIISGRHQYQTLLEILTHQQGTTDEATRKSFSKEAFQLSSNYDRAIHHYFAGETVAEHESNAYQSLPAHQLRYGENPHQKGTFYGHLNDMFTKLSGKEISYNNLLDIDAAINLITEFSDPTIGILKHNNACGISSHAHLLTAWQQALAGDPVSAFGGVIISNQKITAEVANEMHKLFFEILIAPDFDSAAIELLTQKPNRILLQLNQARLPAVTFRSMLNGVIQQDRDSISETAENLTVVTATQPTREEISDLLFANKIVKQSKSNTIVLVKNNQLIASGVGMTSRVDALKHAINKAKEFNFSLQDAVMASDAFFPFPDCVEIANKVGIKAVIQPGGSVKDNLSIDYCNSHQMAMVYTGVRHFKH